MTIAASFAPRRALPIVLEEGRWHLAAVVAVMAFVAALAGFGLIALHDARREWSRALAGVLTLQLPADTSPARLEVVLALLRQAQGVAGVRMLDPADTARLLEPWLGKSAPVDLLPLPRLVDIRIDTAGSPDLDELRQRLESAVPEARLDDHGVWLARLLGASFRVQIVAAVMVAAAAVVAAVAALMAVGDSLSQNRDRTASLHALGAEDRDIAALFVVPAAGMALLGGAFGALAAGGVWMVLAGAAKRLELSSFSPAVTDWPALLVVAAAILGSGVIAAGAAGLAARQRLRRLP